jgi:hypothetical protein
VVFDFRVPLVLDVFERRRRDDGKADEENIRLRVRQRAQSIVVLLSSRVPKTLEREKETNKRQRSALNDRDVKNKINGAIKKNGASTHKVNRLAIHHDVGRVVVEHRWDVLKREAKRGNERK